MANKNQVTLTLAGDSTQLEKAFANVGQSSKKMEADVTSASRGLGEGFDRAGEHADKAEQRAMGFRDAITGTQDAMAGAAAIAKGDLTQGFLLAGSGAADLSSSVANLVVPAIKAMVTRIGAAKLLLAGLGVAAAGAGVALIAWGVSARHTSDDVKGLTEDIERFVRTGETTATLKKHFGQGAEGVAEFTDKLKVATAGFWNWDNSLNRTFDDISQSKSAFVDLDTAMAQLVDQGEDASAIFAKLATTYHLNQQQIEDLRKVLPKYGEAAERAKERTNDLSTEQLAAQKATLAHSKSIKELGDRLRGQTDPTFAYASAVRGVEDAQAAADEAGAEFGRNSREYKRAMEDLATAQFDLATAATGVSTATDKDLLPALAQMRDDGLLSAKSFEIIRRRIKEAQDAAKRADGTRIRFQVELTATRIVNDIMAGVTQGMNESLPKFHDGGVVPGAPGSEMLALVQAGERITPPGQSGGRTVIEIRSGGSKLDDAVVEIVARAVRQSGAAVIGVAA